MYTLAIDIGGSFIKYALIDESLNLTEKAKVKTPADSYEGLLDTLVEIYSSLKARYHINGIAISVPGIVDAEKGFVSMGGALRYNDNKNLGPDLEKLTGLSVSLENDAKCAAMAEASYGALKTVDDGFVLIFGTMIGGAYIKDKTLVKGKHFSAGEVSYLITDKDADPKDDKIWGNRCSSLTLCKYFADLEGIKSATGEMVFDELEKGNKNADLALQRFAKEIAVQIFNIQTLLDPELFAIGGGIAQRKELISYIEKTLDSMYDNCIYAVPKAKISLCQFITDANIIGAFSCFEKKFS